MAARSCGVGPPARKLGRKNRRARGAQCWRACSTRPAMPQPSKDDRTTPPWSILLVDDHPVVRESLSLRIAQEPDMQVCGAVGNKTQAMAEVELHHPNLAILDMNLPDGHGLDLI